MSAYTDMKQRHQDESSAFPMKYAFSDRQLDQALEALGATLEDVCTLGMGSVIRKSDVPAYLELRKRQHDELDAAMRDPQFAYEAFLYEMGNHEYHINWQADWDVCSCFGRVEYGEDKGAARYLKELGMGGEAIAAYARARSEFFRQCDENGWW